MGISFENIIWEYHLAMTFGNIIWEYHLVQTPIIWILSHCPKDN